VDALGLALTDTLFIRSNVDALARVATSCWNGRFDIPVKIKQRLEGEHILCR
jgi:hypothetical protein